MSREQPSPDHTDPVDDLKRIIRAGQPVDPPPSPEPDRTEAKKEAEPPSDGPQPAKPRKPSVAIYLTVMFAVAFLMLLLAYFVQQRNNEAIIGNLQNSVDSFATVDELRAENQLLRERAAQADELEQELAELQAEHQELSRAVERNQQYVQSLQQESYLFRDYCVLENQLRNGYYEAAARRLTFLYEDRLSYDLELGIAGNEPNPTVDFDLVDRLNEISRQLEGMGLLEPGAVVFE